jgi:hypothetical protein
MCRYLETRSYKTAGYNKTVNRDREIIQGLPVSLPTVGMDKGSGKPEVFGSRGPRVRVRCPGISTRAIP